MYDCFTMPRPVRRSYESSTPSQTNRTVWPAARSRHAISTPSQTRYSSLNPPISSNTSAQIPKFPAGADAAKGELLLFVDADDRVGETWLREMAQAAETADAITGRVRAYFVRSDETEVLENESDCLEPVFEFWPSAPTLRA